MSYIGDGLDEVSADGAVAFSPLVTGPRGPRALVDGHPCLMLESDNYLGIADHPRLRVAAADAASRWGAGTGSTRVGSGEMAIHRRLERRLAEFIGYEAALVQGPSHMTVAAIMSALVAPGEVVFSDRRNHPGIVAGCRLSRADVFGYEHRDLEHLAWGLERADGASLIVTESVFGAAGDAAPVEDLLALADEFGCRLLVDESHAIGAVGPEGRGVVASAGLAGDVDLVVASLGKALGSYGSFVACDTDMAEYLAGETSSMLCSTSLPPAMTAAAYAALELLVEDPYRVERLRVNADHLKRELDSAGVEVGASTSHIASIPLGGAFPVERVCEELRASGVMVGALRPPLVPDGERALRVTAMATHRRSELAAAAAVIAEQLSLDSKSSPRRLRALTGGQAAGASVPTAGREARRDTGLIDLPDWVEPGEVELPEWIRAA